MEYLEIEWRSEWYDKAIQLRHELLRKPLGLVFSEAELAEEANQWHFGFAEGDQLIAVVVIVPLSPQSVKLRQMAVVQSRQREGHGAALVRSVEAVLGKRGVQRIELHARDVAKRFYEKLGYKIEGQPFIEVNIPHYKMVKTIAT